MIIQLQFSQLFDDAKPGAPMFFGYADFEPEFLGNGLSISDCLRTLALVREEPYCE